MAFLSADEVIDALDNDEPATGSEMDGQSQCSFKDEPHAATSGEEEQPSTANELHSQEDDDTATQATRRLSSPIQPAKVQDKRRLALVKAEGVYTRQVKRAHTRSPVRTVVMMRTHQRRKLLGKGKEGLMHGRKIKENDEETWEESMYQPQRKW